MTNPQTDLKKTSKPKYYTRPLLYTDSIKGEQICRDDMWAVTTEELQELTTAADTAREERDKEIADKLPQLAEEFEKYMLDVTFGTAIHGMGNVYTFVDFLVEALQQDTKE